MIVQPDAPWIHSRIQLSLILRQSEDESLGIRDSIFSADQLIRHGCHAPALRIIDRLRSGKHRNQTFQLKLDKLIATNEQLLKIPELESPLKNPALSEKLLSFKSLLLKRGAAANRLIVEVLAKPPLRGS